MEYVRKNAWLLLAALLVAGCGEPRYWYKPDTTLDQAVRDCRDCCDQARNESSLAVLTASREAQVTGRPFISEVENHFEQAWAEDAPERCLKARGYRKVPRSELPRSIRTRWWNEPFCESYDVAGR